MKTFILAIAISLPMLCAAQNTSIGGSTGSPAIIGGGTVIESTTPAYPVTIPDDATEYGSLEQQTGWTAVAKRSIAPHRPSAYAIIPAGGGGSTMVLSTTGRAGLYTGWMAQKRIRLSGQLHMVERATFIFDTVAPIQAWETGRRYTNPDGITDNGQTEFDHVGRQMGFNINTRGSSWTATGCRFPKFVANTLYSEELYWISDPDGALSLMYVELNGTVCPIPARLQHVPGTTTRWRKNVAVAAWQPDTTRSAATYNATVTMSFWAW